MVENLQTFHRWRIHGKNVKHCSIQCNTSMVLRITILYITKDWWYLTELLRQKADTMFVTAQIGVASEKWPIEKRFCRVNTTFKL